MNPAIAIRPYTPDDVPILFAAVRESITELSQWMTWCTSAYSMNDTVGWLATRAAERAAGRDYPFAIVDAATGEYYGGCGINQHNRMHDFCNLGYWVRTTMAGRGIATAAVPLVADFAFRELNVARVEIVADVNNIPSRRVAEKAGAHFEGVLRNRLMLHGEYVDAAMYSLVRGKRSGASG